MCTTNYVSRNVVGNSNCFFQAIAFLITGSELSHNIICVHLVAYIADGNDWDHLKPYAPTKYHTGLEYVNTTRMSLLGEWVTEVELFTCAQYMGRDVVVYTAHGWLRYKQSGNGWESDESGILFGQSKWLSFQSSQWA